MRSLNTRLYNLEETTKLSNNQHVIFLPDKTIILSKPNNKIYIPSKTAELFHKDETFIKLVMGPYGSGKSTMCLHEIVRRACAMPVWRNGRRRSRWAIVRNTSGELNSTTLQSWLLWFSDLGDINKRQKPLLTYEHIFNDGKGIVELELVFIALDREDDIRKIKSLEVTGAYINELSEVPSGALSHFKGRVNHRYPSVSFCKDNYWSGIIADTNPPDTDHWIYRDFEIQGIDSYKIFHQPPGLLKNEDNEWYQNPDCDNFNNINKNYYTLLASGQTEEFVKVYCLGEYGIVGTGKKVYPEYNDDFHSAEIVEPIQGEEINVGWDFGLTPACIVTQITPRGQLLVLKEYTSEDMGIRSFAEHVVLPSLKKDFPYNPKIGFSVADPSGIKRDEIMAEFSAIGELNKLGITTVGASTNDIETRISSVRYFLNSMVDGKPCFLLSRKNCPILRRGFAKDYIYKRVAIVGEERYRDKPDKNMSSHPHDALQYITLELASNKMSNETNSKLKVSMYNPTFSFS